MKKQSAFSMWIGVLMLSAGSTGSVPADAAVLETMGPTNPGAARIAVSIAGKSVQTGAFNTPGVGYRVEAGHYSSKTARFNGRSTAVPQARTWALIPVGLGLIGLTLRQRKLSLLRAGQD
jgi:hypothetical protein